MPAVQDKKQVNRELQRLGLGHLSDPNLIAQMAYLVRDHDHFRGILMHMPPGDRHEAYKCLAPKLRFKARSLEDYEIQSKQLAEKNQLPEYNPATLEAKEWGSRNITSQPEVEHGCICSSSTIHRADCDLHGPEVCRNLGIEDRAQRLAENAQRAIARDLREEGAKYQLRLVCRQCTFEQTFRVKRKSSAYKLARTDGWHIDSATALCRLCKPKPAIN